MNTRERWTRIFAVVGVAAMLAGALDPMEGSIVVLAGVGLVTLGLFAGGAERGRRVYWSCVFGLVAVGVGALWVLSAYGGFGGDTGRSMSWGLLILPYPVGWIMGIVALLVRAVQRLRRGRVAA